MANGHSKASAQKIKRHPNHQILLLEERKRQDHPHIPKLSNPHSQLAKRALISMKNFKELIRKKRKRQAHGELEASLELNLKRKI